MREQPSHEILPAKERPRLILEIGSGGSPTFALGKRDIPEDSHYVTVNKEYTTQNLPDMVAPESRAAAEKLVRTLSGDGEEDRFVRNDFSSTKGDGRDMAQYPDGSVDEVVFNNVLSEWAHDGHTADQLMMLKEAARVLVKDGKIIINETRTPGAMAGQTLVTSTKEPPFHEPKPQFIELLAGYGLEIELFTTDHDTVRNFDDHQWSEASTGGAPLHIVLKKKV